MRSLIGILMFLLLASHAIAQPYEYELSGTYKLDSSVKKPIVYNLKWAEENGIIEGKYSDNYFVKEADIKGTAGIFGRTFAVTLPEEKAGVQSLVLLSGLAKQDDTATTMPVSVVTRDVKGNPLTTVKADSNFTSLGNRVAQLQEEPECLENFGELRGYCGVYAGIIAEDKDPRNKCNLLFADAVRLELTTDGMVHMHLGRVNDLVEIPTHTIGRIPADPGNTSIDLLGRVCEPLVGVNTPGDSCKRLHLNGRFAREDERLHFNGTYTITQEDSNNFCTYDLTMDRIQIAQ